MQTGLITPLRILVIVWSSVALQTVHAEQTNEPQKNDHALPLVVPFDSATAQASQAAWAKSLGKRGIVDKNSLGMELVLIPPGKFAMGSPPLEKEGSTTEDQAEVILTKWFYLSKTEVTQRQWKAVMGTSPWKHHDSTRDGDNSPATGVSWDDARVFCKKLSSTESSAYRLPTEAEWEYACRAGTTTRFSFGDDESRLKEFAWYDGNADQVGEKFAHEVGRKQPNSFGLYDLHGNVWEWCEDHFADRIPGGPNPHVSHPGPLHVLRGGCWFSEPGMCRSADRSSHAASGRLGYIGFRVVRLSIE